MLHQLKWTSVLSFDERTAMKMLKSSRFHLLLYDAFVHGVSIMQNIDEIRAHSHDAPLAIMSSVNIHKIKSSPGAPAIQADFVIPKPFKEERLKALLADTNAYHRARMKEHHILVVEDDLYLRRQICGVLSQVGYKVSEADNMEDAFFDHNLGMVDVVVTAILISGIGGVEGTYQLKRDFGHVKVVAMSQGVDDKITAVHVLGAAKAAGADALLPKPFHMPELLKAVSSVIRAKDAPSEDTAAQAAVDAIFGN